MALQSRVESMQQTCATPETLHESGPVVYSDGVEGEEGWTKRCGHG